MPKTIEVKQGETTFKLHEFSAHGSVITQVIMIPDISDYNIKLIKHGKINRSEYDVNDLNVGIEHFIEYGSGSFDLTIISNCNIKIIVHYDTIRGRCDVVKELIEKELRVEYYLQYFKVENDKIIIREMDLKEYKFYKDDIELYNHMILHGVLPTVSGNMRSFDIVTNIYIDSNVDTIGYFEGNAERYMFPFLVKKGKHCYPIFIIIVVLSMCNIKFKSDDDVISVQYGGIHLSCWMRSIFPQYTVQTIDRYDLVEVCDAWGFHTGG